MFIYNSWYVAAWSNEIELGGKPFSRIVLGEPIVMFRTTDGTLAALEGRCAHRRMSLVNGKVIGDNLVCCYHGLTYDTTGQCVRIPGQATKPPVSLHVRSYPAVERYGAVWLWMGDPKLADATKIFNCAPIDESSGENSAQYYWHIQANYLYLNDNLSDLLHQAYLHNPSFGGNADPLGETRPTLSQNGDRIQINWDWSSVPVPLTYGELGGIAGLADGWNHSEYTPPCFYVNYFGFAQAGTGGIETPRKQGDGKFLVSFYQLITPETERTTHFFKLVHCEMPEMLPRLALTVEAVNAEDNWACEEQQKMEDMNPEAPRHAIATDAGVIAMRRVVERLYLQEQQTRKLQPT
jgi:phenylpropionate dioxygenase-like ring-hydroxylating dioxygenase large terminal subunit